MRGRGPAADALVLPRPRRAHRTSSTRCCMYSFVELKKREGSRQVRTPAHQLPAPPYLAQILAVPGPVECMCTRRARAAGRPLLFAGMMVVATPPTRHRQRRFTARPPCVPPSRHAQLQPTAPLTECLRDRPQAAGAPHSSCGSSPRCSFRLRKALRAALALHLYTGALQRRRGPKSSRVDAAHG